MIGRRTRARAREAGALAAVLLAGSGALAAAASPAEPQGGAVPRTFPGRSGMVAFDHRTARDVRNAAWGDVYVVDRRGGSLRRVARRAGYPDWSPEGGRLAINTAFSAFRVLPGTPTLVVVPVYGPSWAPDGQRLVGTEPDGGIAIYDLRTNEEQLICDDTTEPEEGWTPQGGCGSAEWSPAGGTIAITYDYSASGGDFGISFFDVASARDVRVLRGGQSPSWSPGGRWIAFDTYRGGNKPQRSAIYVARTNGRSRRLVVRNGHSPAWSPDGKQIAFVRRVTPTNSDIFVVNVNGSGIRRLTRLPGLEGSPSWQSLRTR